MVGTQVTWSGDGKRWFVDSRPWLDELKWQEALDAARSIRVRQDRKARGDRPICETCADEGQLVSVDAERRRYSVPCPTCRPAQYRHAVNQEASDG